MSAALVPVNPGRQEHRMPTSYVITVRGHLDLHWSVWFEGLTITNVITAKRCSPAQ